MEIQHINIADLEQNKGQIVGLPSNPRTWTQTEIDRIAKSLKETPELFEMRPVIVVKHKSKYIILAGNLRYAGAKQNGDKDVPCVIVPSDFSTDKIKEIVIKDNGSFGSWDWKALENEWSDNPLEDWGVPTIESEPIGAAEPEAKEDDFNEEKEEIHVICQKGDVWQLGSHRLMCGDSVDLQEVKKLMGGGVVDLLLTDPPYNVAVSNSQNMTIANDNMTSSDFRHFLNGAFRAANSVMKDGCPFYVWYGSKEHINFEGALNDAGLQCKQILIWNKNHFVLGRSHYQWKHEPCLYGWKGDSCNYFIDARNRATVIEDSAEIDIDKMKKDEMRELLHKIYDDSLPTTVIDADKPLQDTVHPTMKPVRLIGYLMSNSSRVGDNVLDLFGGSGTTLIAAEMLNRKCYMMELDPHYCDIIVARWEKLTGLKAEKIDAE